MATYKGSNKTKIDAMKPSSLLASGDGSGKLRVAYDQYTALGTEAAGSIIEMGPDLPVGARIIDIIVYNGDGAATLAVGDLESTARY